MSELIFAVKDTKSGKFFGLQPCTNGPVFCRNIAYQVNFMKDSSLHTDPEDFDLYCIGSIEVETGELKSDVQFICNASSLVK